MQAQSLTEQLWCPSHLNVLTLDANRHLQLPAQHARRTLMPALASR